MKIQIPLLPDKALSQFIKPDDYNLDFGDRVTFQITGQVAEGKGNDLFSIPVSVYESSKPLPKDAMVKGAVGLNKTHAKMFVKKYGRDTDNWIDGRFTSVVNAGRNPQTGQQVKTWLVLENSIQTKSETLIPQKPIKK